MTLNPDTGSLNQASSVSTQATTSGAVHVLPIQGTAALVASNFNAGSASFVGLTSDTLYFSGSGQKVQFTGPLPNQQSAHAHQVNATKNGFKAILMRI